MLGLFGKKPKTPAELVKHVKESITALEKAGDNAKQVEKVSQQLSQDLASIKGILYDVEPNTDQISQVTTEFCSAGLLLPLFCNLSKLEFEAKKDFVSIFNNLLRRQVGTHFPLLDHITSNPIFIQKLIQGYENPDIALNCGSMLREVIRHESLTKMVLEDSAFWNFFKYVEMSNFDAASDAFASLKDILTKHKPITAEFLEKNYEKFFVAYDELLHSQNYVTKRQSLKLLGEMLLDRANFNVMTRYISIPDNLKLMMTLLKDKSRSIPFEAFHVFKIFVANPNKPKPILDILVKNKEKLLVFLNSFQNDKDEEQFNEEKSFLMKQIQAL